MQWGHNAVDFLGGGLLTNAVPHLVSGVMGRPFQSPFAKPPGEGLSSSTVNFVWGFANLVASYVLLYRVGNFDFHSGQQVCAFGFGILLTGIMLARLFGRFHGGNSSGAS